MNKKDVLTESEAVELLTNLVMSARTQLDEPAHYASMRLLDTAAKLAEMMDGNVSAELAAMVTDVSAGIEHSHDQMADKTEYAEAIDTVCERVATYLVATSSLEAETDGA